MKELDKLKEAVRASMQTYQSDDTSGAQHITRAEDDPAGDRRHGAARADGLHGNPGRAPRPAGAEVTPPAESESGEPTSGGDSPLDSVEPCDLLTENEVADLGVTDGEHDDGPNLPGCYWNKSGDFSFSIGLVRSVGIDEVTFQGATPEPVDVGDHEAVRVRNQGGGEGACAVLIATSDSSYVDVTATASGGSDIAKACRTAENVAQLVDPKLSR